MVDLVGQGVQFSLTEALAREALAREALAREALAYGGPYLTPFAKKGELGNITFIASAPSSSVWIGGVGKPLNSEAVARV